MQPGQRFERYEVLGKLGEGGMGAVYKVRQDGATYAMKLMKADPNDHFALTRFQREAEIAAAIRHPHVITIHRAGVAHGCVFLIFEFIEGCSLDALIKNTEAWSPERAFALLEPLASALDALHSQGIIHRDLKPANVFIRQEDNAPVLGDFGIAKSISLETMTRTGEMLGTPVYMSPEQVEGEELCPATDIWAFGVIAYELLSGGHRPFDAATIPSLAARILTRKPDSLSKHVSLPMALESALYQAFEKDPKKRVSRATTFVKNLRDALENPIRSGIGDALRRSKRTVYFSLIAALILVLGFGIDYVRSRPDVPNINAQYRDLAKKETRPELVWTSARHFFLEKQRHTPPEQLLNNWLRLEDAFSRAPAPGLKQERGQLALRLMLEGYQGPVPRVKAPYNKLCKGLRAFSKGQFREAKDRFQGALGRASKMEKVLIQLALGFTDSELGQWSLALQWFESAQSELKDTPLGADITGLVSQCRREQMIDAFFQSDIQRFVDLARKYQLKENPAFQRSFQSQCEEQLKSRLKYGQAKSKREKEILKAFHARQTRIRREIPWFQWIFNEDLLRLLIEENKILKRGSQAYYFRVLLYQRSHPQKIIDPDGVRRDYGTVGRSIDVMLMVYATKKEFENIAPWLSVVYNLGIPLESVQPLTLEEIRRRGLFADIQRNQPWDTSHYFWSGLGMSYDSDPSVARAKNSQRIRELERALKDPEITPLYRALSLSFLARYHYQSALGVSDPGEKRALCLKLLEQAKDDHPEPDDWYISKQTYLLWGQTLTPKLGARSLELLKKAEAAIRDRYQRTAEGRLSEGRPLKAPLHSLDRGYQGRLMSILDNQAGVHRALNQKTEAIALYKKATQIFPSPESFQRWLSCIGPGQAIEDYKEIRESLDRWRSDRRVARDVQRRLNEVYSQLPKKP